MPIEFRTTPGGSGTLSAWQATVKQIVATIITEKAVCTHDGGIQSVMAVARQPPAGGLPGLRPILNPSPTSVAAVSPRCAAFISQPPPAPFRTD